MVIDFSPKHDILIYHKDGTLTPMDEPYYETEKIGENTWKIMSSGDYHYLVVGDEEGIAIDTGYAAGNLREYLEQLCGKPVKNVINTHFHFDHSALDSYFDKVYISAVDAPKACIPYASFDGIDFPREYEEEHVGDGSIIPLKGRELEIFEIGDHTPGGIAILDRKERILFTGDEFMGFGKMMGDPDDFLANMSKLAPHRGEFDTLCGGGGQMDAEMFDIFYEAAQKIAEGERSEEPERKGAPKGMRQPPQVPGKKVYDCQNPHEEDMPKHGPAPVAHVGAKKGCLIHRGKMFKFNEKQY